MTAAERSARRWERQNEEVQQLRHALLDALAALGDDGSILFRKAYPAIIARAQKATQRA